jgi:hypothetical protein
LGTNFTNQISIREDIKSRLKTGDACYHPVQDLLSSSLPSKFLKITICRPIILPVVLYGSETWSLTIRWEHRLKVFENRVSRSIFGSERDGLTALSVCLSRARAVCVCVCVCVCVWRKLHNKELNDLYSSTNIVRVIK